jgi:hypothetical protein
MSNRKPSKKVLFFFSFTDSDRIAAVSESGLRRTDRYISRR